MPLRAWRLALLGAMVGCVARPQYDVVITNGRIVDGAGNPWFYGDVGVRGDRIVTMAPAGALGRVPTARRIDATGRIVCPGFIDLQGQSREAFLVGDGRVVSKITQGVTSEILGERWTDAPTNARTLDLSRQREPALEAAADRAFTGAHGFDAWLRAMVAHGVATNVGSFMGQETIRVYAMGEAMREPTAAELDTMRAVVQRGMADGAFGVASALLYPPGSYARTDELIDVVRASAPGHGLYITHMRSEGAGLLDAIAETIQIAHEAGVPAEIYHFKAAGSDAWPNMGRAIAAIDSARGVGISLEADMYPYTAAATDLASRIPPWAHADGKLQANLADAATRDRIRSEMPAYLGTTPDGVVLLELSRPENQRWIGQRLSDVAAARHEDWRDAIIELLRSEGPGAKAAFFLMTEDNVRRQMALPWIKFATDAAGVDPDSTRAMLHPRGYGTFPRILGRYVRDEHVLMLEDAIRKMTSAPAARLGLWNRGILRPGAFADIVVFDPASVIDRSTYASPNHLSVGIQEVLVNGVAVVRDGAPTGALPGRVLRGAGYRGRA
jgi:N-acyl-D-amino-acid deacylase